MHGSFVVWLKPKGGGGGERRVEGRGRREGEGGGERERDGQTDRH